MPDWELEPERRRTHRKSGAIQTQWLCRTHRMLLDRLKPRWQWTFWFCKAGGLLIPACVVKQHLGCVILGSGLAAEEVRPWLWSGAVSKFCPAGGWWGHRPPAGNGGTWRSSLNTTSLTVTFRLVADKWMVKYLNRIADTGILILLAI